jgi:disease resistance protein RPM1
VEKNHGFLQIKSSLTQGSSSSAANENTILNNLREAPFYIGEAQVVGFEAPRDELVNLLIKGREELTAVSVVGMGGQGKTTLAKQVFDCKEVIGYFDCCVWITVSRHTVEGLLRDMLQNIYKQEKIFLGKFLKWMKVVN